MNFLESMLAFHSPPGDACCKKTAKHKLTKHINNSSRYEIIESEFL